MKYLISATIALTLLGSIAPASANYFANPRAGTNLNIGSAPNPKPRPRIVETTRVELPVYRAPAEVAAPPVVVAEVPPAPPAPPPAVRKYIVFFDFDKSNLTMEARQVVGAAVSTAKETGMVRVLVTGHTDTVGSDRYNQALSERRAASVKSEIVGLGLNESDVTTVGKSFSEPLVATGPGVREPQNRRAVIDLGYNATASAE